MRIYVYFTPPWSVYPSGYLTDFGFKMQWHSQSLDLPNIVHEYSPHEHIHPTQKQLSNFSSIRIN